MATCSEDGQATGKLRTPLHRCAVAKAIALTRHVFACQLPPSPPQGVLPEWTCRHSPGTADDMRAAIPRRARVRGASQQPLGAAARPAWVAGDRLTCPRSATLIRGSASAAMPPCVLPNLGPADPHPSRHTSRGKGQRFAVQATGLLAVIPTPASSMWHASRGLPCFAAWSLRRERPDEQLMNMIVHFRPEADVALVHVAVRFASSDPCISCN